MQLDGKRKDEKGTKIKVRDEFALSWRNHLREHGITNQGNEIRRRTAFLSRSYTEINQFH